MFVCECMQVELRSRLVADPVANLQAHSSPWLQHHLPICWLGGKWIAKAMLKSL